MAALMGIPTIAPAFASDVEANGKYYSRFASHVELLEHVGEVQR